MTCIQCKVPAEIFTSKGFCLPCLLATLKPPPVLEEALLSLRQEVEITLEEIGL